MKFVALALTILLAAGSQARFLQADEPAPAPSQLEHVRAAVGLYLQQVKDTAQKAIAHLDDAEYKDYKDKLTKSLDTVQTYIQSASKTLAPYTDAVSAQVLEGTKDMREKIQADIDKLKVDLEPLNKDLKETLDKHVQDYRVKLEPLVKDYMEMHKKEMDAFRTRMEPVVEELRAKIASNVEETKSKLVPIVDRIRTQLTQRLEELKEMAKPYVEEYKEQLTVAVSNIEGQVAPQVTDLQGKFEPFIDELKTKLLSLWETLSKPKDASA